MSRDIVIELCGFAPSVFTSKEKKNKVVIPKSHFKHISSSHVQKKKKKKKKCHFGYIWFNNENIFKYLVVFLKFDNAMKNIFSTTFSQFFISQTHNNK